MSWAIERAITQGYDSACAYRKEAPHLAYDYRHPHWRWFWESAVLKSDVPDYGLERVRKEVLQRVKVK